MAKAKPKDDPPNLMEDLKDLTAAIRELVEVIHDLIQTVTLNGSRLTPVEQQVGKDPKPHHRGSHDRGEG
jgi:hypothetical protein